MQITIDLTTARIVFTTTAGVVVNLPAEIVGASASVTTLTVPALESITFADVLTYVGSSE